MSYISPNSTIRILSGVPLDDTYDHTIYWNPTPGAGGATAQRDYFISKTKGYGTSAAAKYTLTAQSYQRVKRGYIRCEIPVDDLYDCNYLMFQNTSYGAKWFYAFIKSVEYINDAVSEIEFSLDVMQTWHFNYELEECFVEREHTTTDVIGENTVPENLEIGDYLYLDAGKTFQNKHLESDFSVCIAALWKRTPASTPGEWETADANAGFYNGMYSGLYYNVIPLNQTDSNLSNSLYGFLSDLEENRKEEIVGIYMLPNVVITEQTGLPGQCAGGQKITRQKHYSWSGGVSGKFEPVNKKLYTFPYNTLYVTSSDGDSAYYKYELFEKQSVCEFVMEGAMGVPPEIGLTPSSYAFDGQTPASVSFTIASVIISTFGNEPSYTITYTGTPESLVGMRFTVNNGSKIYTVIEGSTGTLTDPTAKVIKIQPDKYSDAATDHLAVGNVLTSIDKPNYNFTLSLKNFPLCSWVTDTFRAWLAQNSVRLIGGVATTVAGAVATGGVIGATAATSPWMTQAVAEARTASTALNAGSGVANSLLQIIPAALQPDHAHGVSKGMLGMANGEFGYHFYYARIKDEFARIIDDYFTRYGYAVKRNKKPNRNARPHWTYTKVIGCTIKASIPAPDVRAICDIYNNGITFWNTPSEIGNYDGLDNRPVTSPTPVSPSSEQTPVSPDPEQTP